MRTLVDEGAVKKATVYRGGDSVETIKGDYEEAEPNGAKKSGKFSTKVVWSDSIQKFFDDHNVPLEFQPANQFWMNLLISTAPFVFVMVVLYFIFIRQIKLAGQRRDELRQIARPHAQPRQEQGDVQGSRRACRKPRRKSRRSSSSSRTRRSFSVSADASRKAC